MTLARGNEQRNPATLFLRLPELLILLLYIAVVCATVPFHEGWSDEAQAWLLARDLSIPKLLLQHLRYEGHPPLWYLLLWVPAHLGLSFGCLSWISAAISIAGVWILLRYSPFPMYVKALVPFTYFFAYQYSVIARSYAMFAPLGFLAVRELRRQPARPVRLAIFLALLANVSIHGTLVALALAGVFAYRQWRTRGNVHRDEGLQGAAIFVSAIAVVAVCLWPVRDLKPTLSARWSKIMYAVSVPGIPPEEFRPAAFPDAKVALVAPYVAAPAGSSAPAARASNASPAASSPAAGARAGMLLNAMTRPVAPSRVLALLFDLAVAAYLAWRRQPGLLLAPLLLLLFLAAVYAAPWHLGLFFITVLMVLWAAWDAGVPATAVNPQNFLAGLLALVCVTQLPWTWTAVRNDIREPYSPDQATAAYLRSLPSGTTMAGFDAASGVLAYFPHPVFLNWSRYGFVHFGLNPFPTVDEVLARRPDVVVTSLPSIRSAAEAEGYRVATTFCGRAYLLDRMEPPACLDVLQK